MTTANPEGRHSQPSPASAEPLDVVCAVVITDGQVLMAQRGQTKSHPGLWEFVGGKVEPGETPEEAIVREVHEELGLTIRPVEVLEAVVFANDRGRQIKLIPIKAVIVDGTPTLTTDHQAVRWIKLAEIMTLSMAHGDALIADRIRQQEVHRKI